MLHTILTRHLKNKVSASDTKKLEKFQTVFFTEVKDLRVDFIKEMHIRFFVLTKENVCSLAEIF